MHKTLNVGTLADQSGVEDHVGYIDKSHSVGI